MSVVVLGSKSGSPLPEGQPDFVYSANAAVIRTQVYRDQTEASITAFVATGAMLGGHVVAGLRAVQPETIVVVGGEQDGRNLKDGRVPSVDHACTWQHMNSTDRYELAKRYLGHRLAPLGFRRLTRHYLGPPHKGVRDIPSDIYRAIRHPREAAKPSTGIVALIRALLDHPEADVIVSGIGLGGGGHFHPDDGIYGYGHSAIDVPLIRALPETMRVRLTTVDADMSAVGGIKLAS